MLTNISEERIASILRVEEKEENPRSRKQREYLLTEDRGDTFLRNVG
jgi:hypothetical protein